jgi:hypothetical protein
MIKYASKLSDGFPFVRIDFYDVNGFCYFGEMTLTPHGGNVPYLDKFYQNQFGMKIELSTLDNMKL